MRGGLPPNLSKNYEQDVRSLFKILRRYIEVSCDSYRSLAECGKQNVLSFRTTNSVVSLLHRALVFELGLLA